MKRGSANTPKDQAKAKYHQKRRRANGVYLISGKTKKLGGLCRSCLAALWDKPGQQCLWADKVECNHVQFKYKYYKTKVDTLRKVRKHVPRLHRHQRKEKLRIRWVQAQAMALKLMTAIRLEPAWRWARSCRH